MCVDVKKTMRTYLCILVDMIYSVLVAGLPRVREIEFFQGQGIVREFCELSGNFGNMGKCQGIVREF